MIEVARGVRKVGLHHFAFYRGHLEGLPLNELGNLYLETGDDKPRAKATLDWLRAEFVSAAKLNRRPAVARLLRIPEKKLQPPAAAAPAMTLEEFQDERDPHGFYTQEDLIRLFEEEVGLGGAASARRMQQVGRLRRQLRDALLWLEALLAAVPAADDAVEAWIDPVISMHLVAAGIATLSDLTLLMRRRGRHWHRKVAKVGPTRAASLQAWLKNNHLLPSDTLPVPSRQAPPAIVSVSCIAPMERLALPEEMSGANGTNRAYSNKLGARNDYAAIEAWLSSLSDRKHTERSYRKEAERFLLWMIFEVGKPLSSATTEDCISYRNFLGMLGANDDPSAPPERSLWFYRLPESDWIGPRNIPRWRDEWRPFSGLLSLSSQKLAVTVLTRLCEWLMRQHYLETNPWDGVAAPTPSVPQIRTDHALTVDQWLVVLETCEDLPKDEAYYRLRFCLLLGYAGGFRISEIAALAVAPPPSPANRTPLGLKPASDGDGWVADVVGKRMKLRSVPLATVVMEALSDYMEARGLGRDPTRWPAGTALVATLGAGLQHARAAGAAVSTSAVDRMLRSHFKRAAVSMKSESDAGRLEQASAHWLRHTHATHALRAGVPVETVCKMLGHASIETTTRYSHATAAQRRDAVETLASFGCRPNSGLG